MTLPRRSVCLMMAALPAARALSAQPASAQDLEAELRDALAGLPLPMTPARLDLIRFEATTGAGQTQLSAVVRLTWPPGLRQRKFDVTENSSEEALQALAGAIQTEFANAG